MKLIKHLSTQPFIVATGIAALLHSTWALAIYFSGKLPTNANALEVFGYYIPAFLIAFSLDVGQIVTSIEIREGQRSRAKYLTFATFALATFFLQFLYISAHVPTVEQGAGVRAAWADGIQFLRDLAVFVLPALLPLSTLLYTFSHGAATIPATSRALVPTEQPLTIEKPAPNDQQGESEVSVVPDNPLSLTFQTVSTNGRNRHE
jgi:hypothetical protein